MKKSIGILILSFVVLTACQKEQATKSGLLRSNFQTELNGKKTDLYVLTNSKGMEMCVSNYGGIVVSLMAADKDGNFSDVVMGDDSIGIYINHPKDPYYGAIIGRYGNRIGNAKFTLDSVEYTLAPNNNGNSLHGGVNGFDNVVWDAKQVDGQTLELSYVSPDGEEGYPGTLTTKVTYKLTDENEFYISYEASTDKATVINLTHHSYFNLKGDDKSSDINGHVLMLNADYFTPVNAGLIPTGELTAVEGTPMDFRTPTAIGDRVNDSTFQQIAYGLGYDHNWVLNKPVAGEMSLAAKVLEPESGRTMEVYTTEPAIQFYGGNFMPGVTGKAGKFYPYRGAFCLETQHFPDSPNKPEFPSTVLRPGETYKHVCIYKFGVEK